MTYIVAAAEKALLLTRPRAQKDAASRLLRSISKRLRQFQQSGNSRSVIICAIPDLAVRLTIMIVVGADDHDFSFEIRIASFHEPDDILRDERLPLDIGNNR